MESIKINGLAVSADKIVHAETSGSTVLVNAYSYDHKDTFYLRFNYYEAHSMNVRVNCDTSDDRIYAGMHDIGKEYIPNGDNWGFPYARVEVYMKDVYMVYDDSYELAKHSGRISPRFEGRLGEYLVHISFNRIEETIDIAIKNSKGQAVLLVTAS